VAAVLAVPIHKDGAIMTNVLRVAPAEVGVEERLGKAPQSLGRGLKAAAADVELDAVFLLFLPQVHTSTKSSMGLQSMEIVINQKIDWWRAEVREGEENQANLRE
jgi:hypothetical protein